MPANLTPQYQKSERDYRRAQTTEERTECLQHMLQLIPKHKGTEKLQADLKTKLKESRAALQAEKLAPKAGKSHRIPRQGAGQVIVLGAPNAGKSRLLAELTNAEPNVAGFPYSTHETLPGMMPWEDVRVQLVDTPPITAAHIEPYLVDMTRVADLALLCFDGSSDDAPEQTFDVVRQFADRKTRLANETGFDENDFSIVHVKTLLVVTRGADPDTITRVEFFNEMMSTPFETVTVEFDNDESREGLRTRIFKALDVMRIYTKRPGKPVELVDPFTIPQGGNVEDVAAQVHHDLVETLQFAKVWNESTPDGQIVSRDHVLCDKDVVELHA
jgi:ribosome-interacting GTPase 1